VTTLLRCAGAWAILTQLLVTASAYGQDKPPLSASPAAVTLDTDGTGSVQLSNDVGVDLELTLGIVGDDGAVVANAWSTRAGERSPRAPPQP
jgi:hypothetical protein